MEFKMVIYTCHTSYEHNLCFCIIMNTMDMILAAHVDRAPFAIRNTEAKSLGVKLA